MSIICCIFVLIKNKKAIVSYKKSENNCKKHLDFTNKCCIFAVIKLT